MVQDWTFGRKIAVGFGVTVALTVIVSVIAIVTLTSVVSSKNRVIDVNSRILTEAQSLETSATEKAADARGFLLTGQQQYLSKRLVARKAFETTFATLQRQVTKAGDRGLLATLATQQSAYQQATDAVVALRERGASAPVVGRAFAAQVDPRYEALLSTVGSFIAAQNRELASAKQSSTNTADTAEWLIVAIAVAAAAAAAAVGLLLTRTLRRQIGTAVGEVNSSSVELQATANQQATSAKEQATAMSEIATTISELLATSRQIAESAQRVAEVAEQTATAGRSGELTVAKAQEFMSDTRRQVEVIVGHMLELGEKSQQIGAVIDIVTELAEQTNILAINSTIEAAGAGEAGKRFAVVADEIRKLADRVADSTKEIRALIDVIRNSVNTTVMATEIGSKAVDAGNEQFTAVTDAFGEIARLAETTNDAVREIELSTKQQTTAVEQVNTAISDTTQSTREAEASSAQTLETAAQLTVLSGELARLVEPVGAG